MRRRPQPPTPTTTVPAVLPWDNQTPTLLAGLDETVVPRTVAAARALVGVRAQRDARTVERGALIVNVTRSLRHDASRVVDNPDAAALFDLDYPAALGALDTHDQAGDVFEAAEELAAWRLGEAVRDELADLAPRVDDDSLRVVVSALRSGGLIATSATPADGPLLMSPKALARSVEKYGQPGDLELDLAKLVRAGYPPSTIAATRVELARLH